ATAGTDATRGGRSRTDELRAAIERERVRPLQAGRLWNRGRGDERGREPSPEPFGDRNGIVSLWGTESARRSAARRRASGPDRGSRRLSRARLYRGGRLERVGRRATDGVLRGRRLRRATDGPPRLVSTRRLGSPRLGSPTCGTGVRDGLPDLGRCGRRAD